MAVRLHEMHPALVHMPIALLPVSIGADLAGSLNKDRALLSFGRQAICVAAIGAVASVVSGLIAGEEVNVQGESRDMLMTHRNLNVAVTIIAACLALWRVRRKAPNSTYLGIGAAGAGIFGYTAYLGGKLVLDAGVGVGPANGVYRPDAPTLRKGEISAFFRNAGTDVGHGVMHMVQELAKGKVVPTLLAGSRSSRAAPQPATPALA